MAKRTRKTRKHKKSHASSVASYMSGARHRAKGRTRRAAARRKAHHRKHARRHVRHHDRLFDAMFDMAKGDARRAKARRKARKGARKATRRAAAPKARKAKAFKLPVHAACVKRVIRANKAKGVRVTLGEASKLCKEMRQAGVKAATAVKAIPAVGPQEQYAKRCRAKFNSLLGNQLERLEEKYCREGWSRAQIEGVLKTTASSLASA